MTDALKKFQGFLQLNITGQADQATLKVMSMPRCGVSDVMDPENTKVAKWNITRLTYKFIKFSQKLSESDVRTAVSNAFKLWAESSKLNFVEDKTSGTIEIQFRKGAHGDGYHFDGKYGVLAHAFFPIPRPIGGDTHFDDDEAWRIDGGKGADLYYIATHEFGHALGLPHSGNKDSVMKPYYAGFVPNLKLHSEDVTEIQKRYGTPKK
ncbi:metalloproteinase-14 isoform X4 [Octopus vulgaris]|nr:72 kDa type IV collagenase-like isoform X2 [Octopus sinensis]CAI9737385.1 metalloproteinase-14 isoform X4 [Octopus vulgaris]